MTDYKPFWKEPFWTEQTIKTTTNPSKNMKTDNDYILLIFAFFVVVIVFLICVTAENYYKGQKELEFVKAGLVQKVENGNIIWTKP